MQNLKKVKGPKAITFSQRKKKTNSKIKATHPDFRVIVSKSNMYTGAQVVDATGNVMACISDKGVKATTKVQRAEMAGQQLAELMQKKGISKAAFDRNGNLYHGRVQALADGLRKGGIVV
ncbi:MAG: 50S ribosomal protein L18 [bacterium]